MPYSEDIDDLFRQQLGGHATPPSPDLWQRLQLPAASPDAPEPVDALFQAGLRDHPTLPRRELWERLEDEHLRPQPRKRRVAAWWQYSAAAVLLLLAGGGLLWRGSHLSGAGSEVAHHANGSTRNQPTAAWPRQAKLPQPQAGQQPTDLAATPGHEASQKKQDFFPTQATAPLAATSSTPIATATRPRRPATAPRTSGGHQPKGAQPDAAAGPLARQEERNTPAGQPLITPRVALPAAHPAEVPLAVAGGPAAPAATPEIIEVEVRRGAVAARPAAPAVVAAAETSPAPARRRGLRLGELLRQADHLVHGEPVNLAEASGPAETVTVHARLGGRFVSKTIQL